MSQAASGGFGNQWQNAANILSKTIEGALQTRILDRRNFTWDLSLTGDHTTQEITSMNSPPVPIGGDNSQGQSIFYYEAGKPLGIVYGTKFVHSFAQLQDNPAYAGANASDYVVNPMGYLVLAADRGTTAERPIVYVDQAGNDKFVIGNVNPKLNYGFQNDIRFNRFSIHANFDGQVGGDIYNFSKQWQTQDLRNPDMNMVGKADAQKIAEDFFTIGLYNGLDPAQYYVESGAYLKLREFSVGYDLPMSVLPRIGLGRASGLRISHRPQPGHLDEVLRLRPRRDIGQRLQLQDRRVRVSALPDADRPGRDPLLTFPPIHGANTNADASKGWGGFGGGGAADERRLRPGPQRHQP